MLNSIIFFKNFFYFKNLLAMPHSMWDFSALTRVRICIPALSQPLDHKGSPSMIFKVPSHALS